MEGNFLSVGGLSLFFVAMGTGVPVLYLHGNVASSRWYSRVMDLPGFRTVALDMPNFGRSSPMPGEVDLHRYADSVAGFIRAAGLDRPVIVGHSLGGAVAQSLAVRMPGLVRGMVLVDSSAPDGLVTPRERHPAIEMMRTDRSILEKALAFQVPALNDPVFFAALVDDAVAMASPAWIGNAEALSRFDVTARCRDFAGPVLVIRGKLDALITEEMAGRTASAYPNGALAQVESVGHALMVEDPAAFRRLVMEFAAAACGDAPFPPPGTDKLRDPACMEE